MPDTAAAWLEHIRQRAPRRPLRILNVCGGHERVISQAGLRSVLPAAIQLIPGPGCPVCVCPEEDIYQVIQLALRQAVTVFAFGDMLRVPVNAAKTEPRSLAAAQAAGADIRAVASPLDVVRSARAEPRRRCVFFAAGFETTVAPVAAMLQQGVPDNLSIFLSGRLTWPAVAHLLAAGPPAFDAPAFDALVAPGHVATVMGAQQWQFVPRQYGVPAAVAGFTTASLLAAFYSVLRQRDSGRVFLDNCYAAAVRDVGNIGARRCIDDVLEIYDAPWRGIGIIPRSGYALRPAYARWDARRQFDDYADPKRRRAGAMPPGCACSAVVLGQRYPSQCKLYGSACTPRTPVGPCMVSDEGACRIWWANGADTPQGTTPHP